MKKEKRFEIVYQEGGFMGAKTIYVDKETGVNYLFIVSGYAGGLTPLLDAEGKLLFKIDDSQYSGSPTGGMNRMMAIQPRAARESRLCSRAWQAL